MIPVPPVPELAVTLAAVALHDAECSDRHCSGPALGAFYRQARIALGAAAPAIRAEERNRLAASIRELWGKPAGDAIAHAIEKGQI